MCSSDLNLTRRIEIGGDDNASIGSLLAQGNHLVISGADERSHGTGLHLSGLLHRATALLYQGKCRFKIQRTGSHQRRVFSKAVPGHAGRLQPTLLQQLVGGNAVHKYRWLRHSGLEQLFFGPIETHFAQRELQHLICARKQRAHALVRIVQIARHADKLRGLTGKYVGYIRHAIGPSETGHYPR